MYINPVLVGVLGTLLVEFAAFVIYGVISTAKKK